MASARQRAQEQRIKASDAEIQSFILRVGKVLNTSLDKILNDIALGKVSGLEAVRMLGDLESVLNRAGLTEEVQNLRKLYADELRYLKDELGNPKALFSGADKQVIETLITYDSSKVSQKISQYVEDVRSTVVRSVISGQEPSIKDLKDELGNKLASQVQTELRTSLMGFSRAVTIQKSKELGFNLFIYVGPNDKITREFCSEILSRNPPIYSVDDINQLDNGQGLDVFTNCGGYNCRHQWRPIGEEEARSLGWRG